MAAIISSVPSAMTLSHSKVVMTNSKCLNIGGHLDLAALDRQFYNEKGCIREKEEDNKCLKQILGLPLVKQYTSVTHGKTWMDKMFMPGQDVLQGKKDVWTQLE